MRLDRGDHRPVLVVQALLWAIMARAGLRGEGRDRVARRVGVALQAARGGRVAGPGLNIFTPLLSVVDKAQAEVKHSLIKVVK